MAALGCAAPKFASGCVISKPPHSPPRCWLQDEDGWDDPRSYAAPTLQFFLMHYRGDAEPANGCLRVLRGSHRRRHALRDRASEAHAETLRRASDPAHPAFRSLPEDAAVPVRAGDAVIGDARSSPPPLQALFRSLAGLYGARHERRGAMPPAQAQAQALIPAYEGAQPPIRWNRRPGPALI